ncbi:hypothetical protein JOQ06_023881 [Pogonophryne albipinna]|uniref:Uncharacterized protein n=1 Tax=Pogonophryne albipinna TaxID=1090488 RepID=A0AAD6BNW7_9TELE|nr:hypothetical protein JOQ06_023881 [Pogonophryne albipinna]
MRSLNNTTLALWVLTVGPMASLGRDQMAAPPVCQISTFPLAATLTQAPANPEVNVGASAPTQSQMRPGSPLQGEEPWRFHRSSLRFLALQHQSANTPPNDVTLLD